MRLMPCLFAMSLMSAPALAAGGTWELLAETGGCTVTLVPEMIDDGIFFVDRGEADCGPDIGRITGYALNDEGGEIVFYSTLEGVDLVGQMAREAEGLYRGTLRNGVALRMEHTSGPKGIADPRTGLTTGEDLAPAFAESGDETTPPSAEMPEETAPPGNCRTYAGGRSCAAEEDIDAPPGGQLQTLTRMNLRDIAGTSGSGVVGQAEAGTCFDVSLCDSDAEGRLWCSVSTAALSGWILKQDAGTVYSRNSCL
ncbi:SH3 domain-containing protein [Falsigemmobacter faecalis]|uniref:SH3 domain-containing protein n=1 Tax=Falsigemmobacter faecalis TaxID=2488730 RepID=A0A3P3DUI6_9RHOB|nr:hypothetical protein [Falsigemmobacter faecalis]RRH77903.1 hypothetical protein EG244_02450 [Falsigemmobacter faecalis]